MPDPLPNSEQLSPLVSRNDVAQALLDGGVIIQHESPGITVVNKDGLAGVWFNSGGEKDLGFFTWEGLRQYQALLAKIQDDPSVRGVLLADNQPTDKTAFYGVDVAGVFGPIFQAVARGNYDQMEELLRIGQQISAATITSNKPVIGAMRNLAVGGGFEFMIPAAKIVQGPQARYGLPECELDVPNFLKERFNIDLRLESVSNGKVLFPGWIGNVVLYNKLLGKSMNPQDAAGMVDGFTFNDGQVLTASEAQNLGIADVTVANDADMVPAALKLLDEVDFTVRDSGLLLPIMPNPHAIYDTPGKVAGAAFLYNHGDGKEEFTQIGERAVALIISAMHHGLGVEGELPYPEHASIFAQLNR